jgi:hypothetical protein
MCLAVTLVGFVSWFFDVRFTAAQMEVLMRFKKLYLALAAGILATQVVAQNGLMPDQLVVYGDLDPRAFPKLDAIWFSKDAAFRQIPVCWEGTYNSEHSDIVRKAVKSTWELAIFHSRTWRYVQSLERQDGRSLDVLSVRP